MPKPLDRRGGRKDTWISNINITHSTTVRWLDIIKLITVGYSDCVSQSINSLAHLVSAAPQCVGELCQ